MAQTRETIARREEARLHTEYEEVKRLILEGNLGLEKEMLRVTEDGHMSHSPHPFAQDEPNITRDFCENQTEINTPIFRSAREVVDNLYEHTLRIQERLVNLQPRELLWPNSNPPYIRDEDDIPVASFKGPQSQKTQYREYLSGRYGRYKMAFSGIHFNYSFSGELLRRNYEATTGIRIGKQWLKTPQDNPEIQEKTAAYRTYESQLYLRLASLLDSYGWIMVVLTAASPLADSSFVEKGHEGNDIYAGLASFRCSELGYWNAFVPMLDYSTLDAYADSIQHYVDLGWLKAPTELYYPVRLKPRGKNSLDNLRTGGINHIELRMIDLNPLRKEGIEVKDVEFAQLLLGWLAATPDNELDIVDPVMANVNYKNAAHYDLDTTSIHLSRSNSLSLREATLRVLGQMERFYRDIDSQKADVISYQQKKMTDADHYRYADLVKRKYADGFVSKTLASLQPAQQPAHV